MAPARHDTVRRLTQAAGLGRGCLSGHCPPRSTGCQAPDRQDQELGAAAGAGGDPGRAAARREHRRGGARHGEFRAGRLRLVKPREGWPNPQARKMASGADRILDDAVLYDTLEEAIADCTLVLATTARAHDQAKPVVDAAEAAQLAAPRVAAGETVGILFGRERIGLENHEVALADRIVTLAGQSGLRLAQSRPGGDHHRLRVVQARRRRRSAVRHAGAGRRRRPSSSCSPSSPSLERELEKVEFFRPPDKRDTMQINLRNIFTRMALTQQDIRTLHGVIMAIAEGRKGPARGGVLDGDEADAACARCSPSTARAGCRTSAARCAGWRGCCAAIRPRPSARSGMRSCATGGSSATASSGRSRSARTSPTSCRSRCGW